MPAQFMNCVSRKQGLPASQRPLWREDDVQATRALARIVAPRRCAVGGASTQATYQAPPPPPPENPPPPPPENPPPLESEEASGATWLEKPEEKPPKPEPNPGWTA